MRRLLKFSVVLAVLAAAIALRIYFWGGAIPARFRVVAAPPQLSSSPAEWTIEREPESAGPPRPQGAEDPHAEYWTARDTDGDGTWDEFITPQGGFARPDDRMPPQRWLIVCLDGMPLAAMQSLWDRGHFREFFRPTATISTLPSDTETALTEALHAPPVPGYEHVYFDRAANSLRGGVWVTLTGTGIPYIRALDYDAPGWAKIVPYIVTRKTYQADVGRFRADFLASIAKVFVAHIASSDALLHVTPMNNAEPLLLEFENALADIYLNSRGRLGVIAFSDHGNDRKLSRGSPIENFLGTRGWRVRGSIDGPRDVAIPAYGLVGFAALYCQPAAIERLADQLRAVEGADVIISRHPNQANAVTIRAAGSSASAELSWTAAAADADVAAIRYRYIMLDGDPLGLASVFNSLRAAGKLDANGFVADADLFAAASLGDFPDAAARIRGWATNHVQNPADILVSLKPGYYHGRPWFGQVVQLTGTHGSLEKTSSLGFAMATYRLPSAVRLSDLIPASLRDDSQ